MAARLVSQGIAGTDARPLIVWNRSTQKATDFADSFPSNKVIVASSAKEVVEKCGVTYSMLSTPEAAAAVFNSSDGTLAGVSSGKAIVDCATLAGSDHSSMSAKVTEKGGLYLEAPVSGSKGPAEGGSLIFLCGGSKEVFDAVLEDGFNVMGKKSFFLGDEVGVGTKAKLVVNSVMGTMLAAFGEGLALTQSVGLDANTMVEIIGLGAVAAPMYGLKGPKMSKTPSDHTVNFPLKHAHKDMALAKEMAADAGVEYKTNNAAEDIFKRARDNGDLNLADLDFSAVFEQIHEDSKGKSEYSAKRQKK